MKILKCISRTWQPKVIVTRDLTTLSTTTLFEKLRKPRLEMNRLKTRNFKYAH